MKYVVNCILICFPIILNSYFSLYRMNLKKEKIRILFSISLFISLIFSMSYVSNISGIYKFYSVILPIVIAYINNKGYTGAIISVILLEYLYSLGFSLFSIVIYFISLYIVYLYYSKSNMKRSSFIIISIILIYFIYLFYLFNNYSRDLLDDVMLCILYYSISIISINYIMVECNNIESMHITLKEFQKDKDFKINLFNITHEVKNPLAVVKGYLQMFDVSDVSKSYKYINIIKGEVDRSINLLNDFLEFTKIKVNKSYFSISILFNEVKDIVIPLFVSSNISYKFILEKDVIVNLDYNRMKQVIVNIIKNAVEACNPYEGLVLTTFKLDKEYLYISVKDNGKGMSKEIIDNIMVPFYTTKESGTGLGVSLSKEIIEAHKGILSYESKVNKGTICNIILPINSSSKDSDMV